jgi:uncharacterized protein with PQ loop repeat
MHEFFLNFGTGLSFLGFIPQAYRTIANRDTLKDISLASQAIYTVCLASFTAYAYLNSIWLTAAIDLIQLLYSLATITFILRANRLRRAAEQRSQPE